jgi:diguanylate cyclase (GGDEF)-like protein
MGGDEFAILCEDLRHPADGAVVAERLETALAAGVLVGSRTIPVRASVGIAEASTRSRPLDLLDQADAAMYAAKARAAFANRLPSSRR